MNNIIIITPIIIKNIGEAFNNVMVNEDTIIKMIPKSNTANAINSPFLVISSRGVMNIFYCVISIVPLNM